MLLKVSDVAAQLYDTAAGRASESCAVPARAMVLPTRTSAGLAERPSMTGQTFKVPVKRTLPLRDASWQVRGTVSKAVWWATTENMPVPAHVVEPSVDVDVSDTV